MSPPDLFGTFEPVTRATVSFDGRVDSESHHARAAALGFVARAVSDLRDLSGVAVAQGEGLRSGQVENFGIRIANCGFCLNKALRIRLRSNEQVRSTRETGSEEIRNPQSEIRNPDLIVFDDVSKFYGEILGVNRVNLQIAPGITSLVGPNGAGKSTLMNLMTGSAAAHARQDHSSWHSHRPAGSSFFARLAIARSLIRFPAD